LYAIIVGRKLKKEAEVSQLFRLSSNNLKNMFLNNSTENEIDNQFSELVAKTTEANLELANYLREKQASLSKKLFNQFLAGIGWTFAQAKKYIRLGETLEGMDLAKISRLGADFLFQLAQPSCEKVRDVLKGSEGEVSQLDAISLKKELIPRKEKLAMPEAGEAKYIGSGATGKLRIELLDGDVAIAAKQNLEKSGSTVYEWLAGLLSAKDRLTELEKEREDGKASISQPNALFSPDHIHEGHECSPETELILKKTVSFELDLNSSVISSEKSNLLSHVEGIQFSLTNLPTSPVIEACKREIQKNLDIINKALAVSPLVGDVERQIETLTDKLNLFVDNDPSSVMMRRQINEEIRDLIATLQTKSNDSVGHPSSVCSA